ncbi:MAG: response regulator transcription factor [Balneolaceae bacterium]
MAAIRVLVADSTDISLAGICTLLNQRDSFQVVGKAKSGSRTCMLYAAHLPDVCLISSNLRDLTIREIMKKFRMADPNPRVIVLSDSTNLTHIHNSLQAGISGYLSKSVSEKELCKALANVSKGENFFSSTLSHLISNRKIDLSKKVNNPASDSIITKREKEILTLITDGYTSQEIAELLFISPRTVDKHRANLLQKLNVKNTAGLVRYAVTMGHLS